MLELSGEEVPSHQKVLEGTLRGPQGKEAPKESTHIGAFSSLSLVSTLVAQHFDCLLVDSASIPVGYENSCRD